MSRPQPQSYPYQNGPSRRGHGRDRVNPQTSSQHVNGTPGNYATSSRTAQASRQRTSEAHDHTCQDDSDSDSDQNTHYSRHQDYAPRQYPQYTEVPRPWATHNSEIHPAANLPALNIIPSPYTTPRHDQRSPNPQGRSSMTQSSLPSAPPPASNYYTNPQTRRSSQSNYGRLTSSNLEEHEQRNPSTSIMRAMLREGQRAGPYDAVGYVRRDGRVYEDEYEYEAYEEQDARSDTLY